MVVAASGWAQQPPPSTNGPKRRRPRPRAAGRSTNSAGLARDKIKGALARGREPLRGPDDVPTFRLEIREKQKISIDDPIATMDFRSGPVVPAAVCLDQNRLAFPAVDNPLQQPYAAFSQSELLTIVIENLAAKYLGGKMLNAVTTAQRTGAEQAARHEVQRAIADYCAARPNGGAGIQLPVTSPRRCAESSGLRTHFPLADGVTPC